MTTVRDFATAVYPEISDDFKEIREWAISKRFHEPNEYPKELVKLFKIFAVTTPQKYLRPTIKSQLIEEVIS